MSDTNQTLGQWLPSESASLLSSKAAQLTQQDIMNFWMGKIEGNLESITLLDLASIFKALFQLPHPIGNQPKYRHPIGNPIREQQQRHLLIGSLIKLRNKAYFVTMKTIHF